ncbi:hypothetical protein Pla123a_07920 [Posidoniimonas polymericola]|uniref:YXWGXW repeat (2 copies) n=1 Tax=Posidoniimonas polymericola TaxID=2528002 RepID=A0A5C5ZF31_9BACT|nr:hypothetical protein [Posidoniimonas polymericola]TWT85984.1 hypothetical protein Pla123a_07920 [Posidoniimonas polymericola]
MTHRFLTGLLAAGLYATSALAQPDSPGAPTPGDAPQVLDHGPVHEAFADPLRFDASDEPITINQQPPEPVNELPPEYKPEGDNVEWIPGYWMWDDTRDDFIWVSGVYRNLPPGQTWVVGYWSQADRGYTWTPGFWTSAEQRNVQYLPYPPESLEEGPTSEAPGENYFWIPGCWQYRSNDYAWQAGYWYQGNQNWVWTPSHYYYTRRGAIYVNGYWDYPLASRGLLYAPVYWNSGYGVGYRYRPRSVLSTVGLLTSLFVGPRYGYHYGPSSYYANYNSYRPWHSAYNTRYGYYGNRGYDPLLAYYAWNFGRNQSGWQNRAHNHWNNDWKQWNHNDDNRSRRDNSFDRNSLVRNAEQLHRSNRNDFRLTRVDNGQLDRLGQQAGQYDQFRRQREQVERGGDRQFSQRDQRPGRDRDTVDSEARNGERGNRGRNSVDATAQLNLPDWARERGRSATQQGERGNRQRGNQASQQARSQQPQVEQQARSQQQAQAQEQAQTQARQRAEQQARAQADPRQRMDQRRDQRTFSNQDGNDARSRGNRGPEGQQNRELRAYRGPDASAQQDQQRAQQQRDQQQRALQQRAQDQQRSQQQRAQQQRDLQQRSQPQGSQQGQPSFRGFRGGQSPSAAPQLNRSMPQQSQPNVQRRSVPQVQPQRSAPQRAQSPRVQTQPAPSRRAAPAPNVQRSRGPSGPPAAQQGGGGGSFRGFRGGKGKD